MNESFTRFFSFTIFTTLILSSGIVRAQTFTRITTGPVVSTPGDSRSVNWVDVNNDGFLDLQITNGPEEGQDNFLYINNGLGGFAPVINSPIVSDSLPSDGATWADTDNDGDLDCFVANYYDSNNVYYENFFNGSFAQNTSSILANDHGFSETASWGDYDNDGLVDLYVTNSAGARKNYLYHNNGNQSFTKIIVGPHVADAFASRCVNWTDIDSDGDLDLFITNENLQNENLYRNDGDGSFVKITAGALVNNGGRTMSASWGDYDNDGDLDVFLANDRANNALFRNEGNFVFTKITGDTAVTSGGNSFSSAWSDIDNDGDLDLFVTNAFWTIKRQVNFLYLNQNGAFIRINNTAPATDSSWSYGCAFGDYDNDGFEDLAVATVRFDNDDVPDFLYHNNGNSNHWATFKLVGTTSNRSAIGAKVRAKAMINGTPVWQMREISAQSSYCGQNDLKAHFGLASTTLIDSLKIEWPSGAMDICTGLQTDSIYTITEGQCLVSDDKKEAMARGDLYIDAVYPNPTNQHVFFIYNLLKSEKVEAIVLDLHGKTVLKKQLENTVSGKNKGSIQLEKLPRGAYYLVLKSGAKKCRVQFVKN